MYIITVEDLSGQIFATNEDGLNEIHTEELTLEEAQEDIRVFNKSSVFGTENFRIWLYDTEDETAELVSKFMNF